MGESKKRNSFTVLYNDHTNRSNKFAAIEYFLFIEKKILAVLKPLTPLPVTSQDHFDISIDLSFIHPVFMADGFTVCFVEDIICKCLFLDFDSVKYVLTFPSSMMFD